MKHKKPTKVKKQTKASLLPLLLLNALSRVEITHYPQAQLYRETIVKIDSVSYRSIDRPSVPSSRSQKRAAFLKKRKRKLRTVSQRNFLRRCNFLHAGTVVRGILSAKMRNRKLFDNNG